MSQFSGIINGIGDMLTPTNNILARKMSLLDILMFSVVQNTRYLLDGTLKKPSNYWLHGKRVCGRKYAIEAAAKKKKGNELTWDDLAALNLKFGTSTNLRFQTVQEGYSYSYYVENNRFIVKDGDEIILYDVTSDNVADFSVSWDLFCSRHTTIYYKIERKETSTPAKSVEYRMYGDRQYASDLDKLTWRKYLLAPAGENFSVRYYRIYGDELMWKQLADLKLVNGAASNVRYTSLLNGWRYVYRPQDKTFTVYNASNEIDSQIKTTTFSEFGIVWEILSSHQFYLEWECHYLLPDCVTLESNTKSDGTTLKETGLTVVADYTPLRGENPIREINAKYQYKLYRLTKISKENRKVYGDELKWEELQSTGLIQGDSHKIVFPTATPKYEYFYKPYDEIFIVNDADGNAIYSLNTNDLSEFGLPWSIFSSHQFYIWYHASIADDKYLLGTRRRTRNTIISLEKYLLALISVMLATVSNRNNPVYEPWMLWRIWQWLGESSEEAVYCFDIMPNWGG